MQCPDIRVTIDTSLRPVDLTLDDFDIAIRFSSTRKPAPNWTLLAVETLMPVCSPGLKKQFGGSEAKILSQAPLIHVTSVAADWQHWFRAGGMEAPSSIVGGLRVDTVQMAFDAAARGLGVVLGRRPLVDERYRSRPACSARGPMRSKATAATGWLLRKPSFRSPRSRYFGAGCCPSLAPAPSIASPHDPARVQRAAFEAGRKFAMGRACADGMKITNPARNFSRLCRRLRRCR